MSIFAGYSGSDIATLVQGALFEPVRKMKKANFWRRLKGRKGNIEMVKNKAIHVLQLLYSFVKRLWSLLEMKTKTNATTNLVIKERMSEALLESLDK